MVSSRSADLSNIKSASETFQPRSVSRGWHAVSPQDVAAAFDTDIRKGLDEAEARRRIETAGENVLVEIGQASWLSIFLRQYRDILILILAVAAGLSFAIGDIADALTILAIVAVNGALGFVQEWRAERALAALKRMLSPQAQVVRGGVLRTIDSRRIAPGDLVRLKIGDHAPADLRLVEAVNLKADESALTGESGTVEKSVETVDLETPLAARAPIVFMGSTIANGHASGVVVATGMKTEFGRIAELAQTVDRETTPLQKNLAVLGGQLGIAAIIVSAAVAVVGAVMGRPVAEMLMTGVSLAVAVVPEGLPAVVTITLAVGVGAMVRRRVLLRRLQAAETLGAATVICTDKTGTLTQNEMTVTQIWLSAGSVSVGGVGYDPIGAFATDAGEFEPETREDLIALLKTGLVCNHAELALEEGEWRRQGEPTEAALVAAARKAGLYDDGEGVAVCEFSFNSVRKRMTVIEEDEGAPLAHVKGAPEVILDRCTAILDGAGERPLVDADRTRFKQAYQAMAGDGLRVLALARRKLSVGCGLDEDKIETGLTLLGAVGIIDAPRPEAQTAVATARRAGLKVIMITGDAPETGLTIARRIGIETSQAITGVELSRMTDAALMEALQTDAIFARTAPEDKMRIVGLLQAAGQVVAMTGDGVNDAPALKKADVGIAMGVRGVDVAKSAADMILTDDNFASIVNAVEEGRRQYDNIRKFAHYLLSSNVGEIIAIFTAVILGGPLILLPVQILWMNLVTDGLSALALGVERAERDVMHRPPRAPDEALLGRRGLAAIALLGAYIGLAAAWLFQSYLASGDPEATLRAQTAAFTAIIVMEKFNVFNFRTLRAPLWRTGFFTNPWLLIAVAGTFCLQALAVYAPPMQALLHTVALKPADWGAIVLIAAPVIIVVETVKTLAWGRGVGNIDIAA